MFEITINGRTEVFNTAAEMEAFRERMISPKQKKFQKYKKFKPKIKKATAGLTKFLKKEGNA